MRTIWLLALLKSSSGFLTPKLTTDPLSVLHSTKGAKKQTRTLADESAPAGIEGAEFFGGNKQKEEFYSETIERKATEGQCVSSYLPRFLVDEETPSVAFSTAEVARVASSLQSQINAALYETAAPARKDFTYSQTVNWSGIFQSKAKTPFEELDVSLGFYEQLDVAIASGRQLSDTKFELDWEISVMWPIMWAPRILLLGSSVLELNANNEIISQTDRLRSDKDLLDTIGSQITPRFWDWYHIGMSPTTEMMPRFNHKKSLFKNYEVFEIPERWMTVPTRLDKTSDRMNRNAQIVPNNAFSCIIKTSGPKRQRYTPTTPTEIKITGEKGSDELNLQWSIPLSVEFLTNSELPVPGEDEEADEGSDPDCKYEFTSRRKVATVHYGGDVQDEEVTSIRKKLYESVVKDGLKPILDEDGRPIFFFLQNGNKACYIEQGLGMVVYEERPAIAKTNEVGIELELDGEMQNARVRNMLK